MRAFKVPDSSNIFRSVKKEIRDWKVAKVVRLYRGQGDGTQRVLMQQYLEEQKEKKGEEKEKDRNGCLDY